MTDSDLERIVEPEQVRAALSLLIGQEAPVGASKVARVAGVPLTELSALLSELTSLSSRLSAHVSKLTEGGYVMLHLGIPVGEEPNLSIGGEPGLTNRLMEALDQVEMRFIAQRAARYDIEEPSKLMAIDDLADAVMIARKQVRKRANFL